MLQDEKNNHKQQHEQYRSATIERDEGQMMVVVVKSAMVLVVRRD
jgi:hypothetical protein